METYRFYHPVIQTGLVQLSETESHHFARVLRGTEGMSVELFDGQGRLAEGIVSRIKKNQVFVEIQKVTEESIRKTNRVILATASAKGQRFELMLSKCTELGTDHIALIQYERSVRLGKESAVARYQNIAIAACKQCGRNILPKITGPKRLDEAVKELKHQYPQSLYIYGSPGAGAETIRELIDNRRDAVVFVGPEGGLTAGEIRFLTENGAIPVRVGSHILRTETAAIVFAAILESMRID